MSGVPTKQFLPNSLIKLGKLAMAKDWDNSKCSSVIDPKTAGIYDLDMLKKALENLTSSEFVWTDLESEEIFCYITKVPREKLNLVKVNV